MEYEPIRYTEFVPWYFLDLLAGNLAYFIFDNVLRWQVSPILLPSGQIFQCRASTSYGWSLSPFYTILDGGDTYSTNVILNFGVLTEITIYSLHVIRLRYILILPRK